MEGGKKKDGNNAKHEQQIDNRNCYFALMPYQGKFYHRL